MRGIMQDDDGTNAVSNLDSDLVIGTMDVGETVKIAWDISAENRLTTLLEGSIASSVNKYVQFQLYDKTADWQVVDGRAYFVVPAGYNGHNLTSISANITGTAGTTGTTDIQLHNITDSVDMLSTKLTVDSGEVSSSTAATPVVIDPTKDDVSTGDVLRIDIDAVSTTEPKGGIISMTFTNPA